MNTALKDRRVGDLTTEQLEQAFEQRLVQDGLDSIKRGDKIIATRDYFEAKRSRLKAQIANKT
jgi:ASC-1-like (ASCH) protein